MNKAPQIFVPSGIIPVHLFDVWGVIIDAERKGKDELSNYVKAAYDSKVLPGSHLFYINRNKSNTREKVFEAGIQNFVADVKDVPYRTLVKR